MDIRDRLELIDTQVGQFETISPSPYVLSDHIPWDVVSALQNKEMVIDPSISSYTFSYAFGVERNSAELPLWFPFPREILDSLHFVRYRFDSPSGFLVTLEDYSDSIIDDPEIIGGRNIYKNGIVVDFSYSGCSLEEGGRLIQGAKAAVSGLYTSFGLELLEGPRTRSLHPPQRGGGRIMEPWRKK